MKQTLEFLNEDEAELLSMIKNYGRISVFDIPERLKLSALKMIDEKRIIVKKYAYDWGLKEHLPTEYIEFKNNAIMQ